MGKTALACAACAYIADRRMPICEDGVIYLRAVNITSYADFLTSLVGLLQNKNSTPPSLVRKMRQCLQERGETTPNSDGSIASAEQDEELLMTFFGGPKVLLILDNIDTMLMNHAEILEDGASAALDLKFFLGRLFERCTTVRVLVLSEATLSSRNVSGFGQVENYVPLGPMNLRNTLRLYARLSASPSLQVSA